MDALPVYQPEESIQETCCLPEESEMTLTVAWWLHDRVPDNPLAHAISAVPLLHVAGAPYDVFTRSTTAISRFNRGAHLHRVATSQHSYMVRHGMKISKSSAAHFAQAGVGRLRSRTRS